MERCAVDAARRLHVGLADHAALVMRVSRALNRMAARSSIANTNDAGLLLQPGGNTVHWLRCRTRATPPILGPCGREWRRAVLPSLMKEVFEERATRRAISRAGPFSLSLSAEAHRRVVLIIWGVRSKAPTYSPRTPRSEPGHHHRAGE